MKKTVFLFGLILSLALFAAEIDVNGHFEKVGADGIPRQWQRNAWSGYNPACKLEVVKGGGLRGNSLRMYDIESKRGAAFNSIFYPGRSGDTLHFCFRARGKGKGKVQMYFQTVTGEWNFMSPEEVEFRLGPEWREFIATLPVLNGKAGETGSFDIAVEMENGAELEISDVVAKLDEGRFRGEVPFPDQWTAFGPVDAEFTPSETEFAEIPSRLDGKSGVPMLRKDRTLDMAGLLPEERQCGWLFAEIDSPIDCTYSVGCGADWWLKLFVNGVAAVDTTATGNVEAEYDISNHIAEVRLNQGKNIIAVKLIRGKTSAVVKVGGALEFGQRALKLKTTHLEWIEDFNGKEISCSGNPKRIVGYPAPGLLSPTGQGLFRTQDRLRIDPVLPEMTAPAERELFRTIGLRVQNFGEPETEGELAFVFQDGTDDFRLVLQNDPSRENLVLQLRENGAVLAEKEYPKSALPAEFLLGGDGLGRIAVAATSLSGGASLDFGEKNGFFANHRNLKAYLEFAGKDAALTADNFFLALAREKSPYSTVPFSVNPLPEFDPVKAGWKLVFDDEFDGDDIDWEKWKPSWSHSEGHHTVKDGILTIKADWTDNTHTKLAAASIKSREKFLYGYFEWRGRFKRQSGWWSAFWLYGETNTNAFYDGFEIDIYEDYYLAAMEKGKPSRDVLDHNLHVYYGPTLKSWNYNGPKLEDPDAYTTIGCLWTPFEISYYMNGKLVQSHASHSPYNSVTFDAFNHACGITPLEVIVSSQVNRKSGGPASLGTYPDYFYTDYVRVYELPRQEEPSVRWNSTPAANAFATLGDTLEFSVEAEPNAATRSAIKNVYLFDSGSLVDYKNCPPYDFNVRLTKEFYDATDYVRPGRQNVIPDFQENMHAFVAYVQDESGKVSHTDAWILAGILTERTEDSTPYRGSAAQLPGTLNMVEYDLGGEGVAYHDTTPENEFAGRPGAFRTDEGVDCGSESIGVINNGEWICYTVEVTDPGKYAVDFLYGTPYTTPGKVYLMLEGTGVLGEFDIRCKDGEPKNWACEKHSHCEITLPAGRHVLRVYFLSGLNAKSMAFQKL